MVDIVFIAYKHYNMALLPEDQVPRRQAFERDHPEIKITPERQGWVWRASWGNVTIMSNDLRDLLDELEKRFPATPGAQPEV